MTNITHLEPLEEIVATVIDRLHQLKDLKETPYSGRIKSVIYESENLNQFMGYVTICILDIEVIGKGFGQAIKTWEKVHYVKAFYLLVYESLATFKYHNQNLHKIIRRNPEFQEDFMILSEKIKRFKKETEFNSKISRIRNNGAAHINNDFLKYIEAVSNFKMTEIEKIIIEFFDILILMQTLANAMIGRLVKSLPEFKKIFTAISILRKNAF